MKKRKNFWIVLIIIAILLSPYIILFTFGYHSELGKKNRYLWLFKNSEQHYIDDFFCTTDLKKSDIIQTYNYGTDIHIRIWEFKDLGGIDLKKSKINQNVDMSNVKFLFGEEIDHRIKTRFIFHFKNSFHVNLDNYSKITKWIDATNYKGFYGTISGMSFSNGKGENQILFDYGYPALPLLFLEYKANGSFYTIQIWSDKPFDEKKIINILNLK